MLNHDDREDIKQSLEERLHLVFGNKKKLVETKHTPPSERLGHSSVHSKIIDGLFGK